MKGTWMQQTVQGCKETIGLKYYDQHTSILSYSFMPKYFCLTFQSWLLLGMWAETFKGFFGLKKVSLFSTGNLYGPLCHSLSLHSLLWISFPSRQVTSLFILIFYFKGEKPNSSLLSGLKITASKPISPQNIKRTKSPLRIHTQNG